MNIKAHVPVQAYGFIEIEGTPEEASEIERLYNHYAESPVAFKNGNRKLIKAFSGGEIYYDEAAHSYTNEAGEPYLSGSQYADTFRKPFDKQMIAGIMAKKIGADPQSIIDMWELKSQASRDFGNAIHKALQLYEQYDGLATQLNKTSNQHEHPVIKHAVDSFLASHQYEKVISEALIVDHDNKRAGQVDRLWITARKECYITDFKTNADIKKELEIYWSQLNFYGSIMVHNGWKVLGLKIYHYDGEWHDYDKEFKEIV